MRTINRIIAWLIIVAVVVGILLGVLAIAGSWVVNVRVTGEILQVLDRIQSGLSVLENSLLRLDTTVSSSRELVQTITSAASQLGENFEAGSPILDLLTKSVNEDLVSKINSVRETAIALRDSVAAFNATLVAINAIPGIEVPTLTDELQKVSDRLADLALFVQELRSLVAQVKSGVVDTLVTPITQLAARIEDELAAVQSVLQGFIGQVDAVQGAIATVQSRVPVWIDILTVIVSLVLLWMILAQLALLAVARGYLRTGYLPWSYPQPDAQPEVTLAEESPPADTPAAIDQPELVEAGDELVEAEQVDDSALETSEATETEPDAE
jgi:hypothetical protein